jgi:hypothetical protein
MDCGSVSSRFALPSVRKSGSPAVALQSSFTAARLGAELRNSPRESRHESPRKPRRKPARESNRERPRKRPAASPRQRFPQSPCNSTSKSPWCSDRQSWTKTRRLSRPNSRPKSRPEPRSEPPREPFRERFPPWFPEGRFWRARPRLRQLSSVTYVVWSPPGRANRRFRMVPQNFTPKKRQICAPEPAAEPAGLE